MRLISLLIGALLLALFIYVWLQNPFSGLSNLHKYQELEQHTDQARKQMQNYEDQLNKEQQNIRELME